jgi:hypothetical protein
MTGNAVRLGEALIVSNTSPRVSSPELLTSMVPSVDMVVSAVLPSVVNDRSPVEASTAIVAPESTAPSHRTHKTGLSVVPV